MRWKGLQTERFPAPYRLFRGENSWRRMRAIYEFMIGLIRSASKVRQIDAKRECRKMATYECEKCGMSVNATCGKCDAPLVNDSLKLDDGSQVQVSKCPNGHGKIKSPLCCGQDMTCTATGTTQP